MIEGSALLEGLNEKQRLAVSALRGNLLVLAGAGTGKTRVLVHRIAWLLAVERCFPSTILAVTFSNQAAGQIRQRIDQLLQRSHHEVWIGTFHGMAHRLLRIHTLEAGLPLDFQIIDADDQLQLLRRLIRLRNLEEKQWPARQAAGYINAKKEAGLRPRHVVVSDSSTESTWLAIYQSYQEACDRAGLVDFAELLLRAHELWLDKPLVLEQYRRRFTNILVDEFQDTNSQQYAWIRCLAGESAKVVIVGDDDQSIYGWRGAQVENLQQFCQDFSAVTTVRLEQNYRSSGHILQAANALITHNSGRLGKNLWTESPLGAQITLHSATDELAEARFVVDQLRCWQRQGRPFSDCAILYRNNAQSRVLEEALLRANIPYRIYGGLRFFERQEIKDALAYLRLIVNRQDDVAFERVINTPTRGIGERTLLLIRQAARAHATPLWPAALQLLQQQGLTGRAAAAVQRFLELIEALARDSLDLPLHQQTDQVIRHSGLWQFYEQTQGELGQTRLDNLRELVTATRQFKLDEQDPQQSPLQAFLSHVVLEAGERGSGPDQPAVQLMTLHSAKGLEFPQIFMVGLEEGLFPSSQSLRQGERLEEERRLAYVGITRAMNQLFISYAAVRRLYGISTEQQPSRFLSELPQHCLERLPADNRVGYGYYTTPRGRVEPSEPRLDRTAAPRPAPPPSAASDWASARPAAEGAGTFTLGQRVSHPKFGLGKVVALEGSEPHCRVQVSFDTQGTKWLVIAYARLDRLP